MSIPDPITTANRCFPIDLTIPVQKKGDGAMVSAADREQKRKEEESKRRLFEENSPPPSPERGAAGGENVSEASPGASSASPESSSSSPPKRKDDGPQWAMDAMGFFLTKGEESHFQSSAHNLAAAAEYAKLAKPGVPADERCRLAAEAVAEKVDWWRLRARELDTSLPQPAAQSSSSLLPTSPSNNKDNSAPPPPSSPLLRRGGASAGSPSASPTSTSLTLPPPAPKRNPADEQSLAQWRRNLIHEIRVRVRKQGISPAERAVAWPLLAGLESDRTARIERVMQALLQKVIDPELKDVMLRDLGRTLPTHSLFRGAASIGQTRLERVLYCYCALDPEVGYTQGMGFIVAVLLLHMPEHDAFALFVQMMYSRRYSMRDLFLAGFPLMQRMLELFRRLLRLTLPQLSDHFDDLGVDPAFFASHWFLTLFAYQFSVPVVCRIWDLFLSEGWIWIFRVAIALLAANEKRLRGMAMEEILLAIKSIHEGQSETTILAMAKDVAVRESDLLALDLPEGEGGGVVGDGKFP